MLRPWFNQTTVLAISQQGICLRDQQGNCELLSSIDVGLKGLSLNSLGLKGLDLNSLASDDKNVSNTPFNKIIEALSAKQKTLKNKSVKVVLSNSLVRFYVLPWQPKVTSLNDWQAIAQQAFRQQFGAAANEWRIAISFAKYGEPILAAAIDNALCTQLENCAKQYGFSIESIQPLLAVLLNQTAFNYNQSYRWALIAEPQRVLLCQFNQQGQWQNVLLESPPAGLEYQHANQLVNRSLIAMDTAQQPKKIATFVSSALNRDWQDNISSKLTLITQSNRLEAHPIWLANMCGVSQKSQTLDLNFLDKTSKKASVGGILLLASTCFLAAFTCWHFLQLRADNALLLQQNKSNQLVDLNAKQNQRLDSGYINTVKSAVAVQQQLNAPWMPMLTSLEQVKSQNQAALITSISPNSNRGEIKLNGEANTFAQIAQLLNQLRANPIFSDATLLSQHLEQEADKPNKAPIIVFEVMIVWRL